MAENLRFNNLVQAKRSGTYQYVGQTTRSKHSRGGAMQPKLTAKYMEPADSIKRNKHKSKANKENSPDKVLLNGEKRPGKSSRGENINNECYINIPEPPNGPSYYREKLQTETRLLMGLADELSAIRASTADLPDTVSGEIDSVICGIKLMVSSKFEQFRGLVDECAARFRVLSGIPRPLMRTNTNRPKRPSKPPVKPEDLDGFWEMMNLQVDAIKKKIANLQELQANNWKPKKIVAPRQSTPAKCPMPSKRPLGKSKFRQFLRQKKEAKTENEGAASAAEHVKPNDSSQVNGRDIDKIPKAPATPQKSPKAGKEPHLTSAPLITVTLVLPSRKPVVEMDFSIKNSDQGYHSFFCSTPSVSVSEDFDSMFATPRGEFAPSVISDANSPLQRSFSSTNLRTGPGRESLITPRAAQNMMNAKISRRSSINIICQRAFLARAMSNMEVDNEDESDSLSGNHWPSPISEGSTTSS